MPITYEAPTFCRWLCCFGGRKSSCSMAVSILYFTCWRLLQPAILSLYIPPQASSLSTTQLRSTIKSRRWALSSQCFYLHSYALSVSSGVYANRGSHFVSSSMLATAHYNSSNVDIVVVRSSLDPNTDLKLSGWQMGIDATRRRRYSSSWQAKPRDANHRPSPQFGLGPGRKGSCIYKM